jgi:hypothetical protein
MNYVQDNMFLGQLPKRLVIGCVDSNALNGTITKNIFDCKHYKINFVALNVDGNRIYFDFYTSDGVFTAGHFQNFDATHSYGRT